MSTLKVVDNIEGMINEFKDKINELERQLRTIRDECPHGNIHQDVVESLFTINHSKITTDICKDCGKVLKLVKETIKK